MFFRVFTKLSLAQFAALFLLLALVVLGGASRADELAQTGVRLAAIAVLIILVIWPSERGPAHAARFGLACVVSAILLTAVQLVPLPYNIWTALPGRELYKEIDSLAGYDNLWRPWTLSPDRTWNALFSLIVPLAMLVVLGRMTQGERFLLLPIVLVIIFASAGMMLAKMAGGVDFSTYSRTGGELAAGLFANRNHQALLLALGLPLTASWATEARLSSVAPAVRIWMAIGGVTILTIMIPATGSRAGLVLGAMGLIMAAGIAWVPIMRGLAKIRRRERRRLMLAAIAASMIVLAAALGLSRAVGLQRLLALDVLADTRSRLLPRVLEAIQAFFPFGSGYGSFDPVFRRFERLDDLSVYYFNQAHNDYLQILMEGGLAGVATLAIVLALFVRRIAQIWRRPADRAADRYSRLASMLIVLVLAASVVDFPLRTPMMMGLLALFSVWLNERSSDRRTDS